MAADIEMALPKMLRCHHIFCFCCFTKWFLGSKQNCPVCFASVAIKDIKSVQFERVEVSPGLDLDFVLVQKNLKNHKQLLVGNENNTTFFQKFFPISYTKYEKMVLQEIEELHAVQVSDPMITEFCQFVSMQFISNQALLQPPVTLGRRKTASEVKTYKEDLVDFYQQAKGFNVFIHPVSFDFLLDMYGGYAELPPSVTLKIASIQKMTKSNFNRQFWSVFSHLGRNSDFLLVHVDFSEIYPKFDPALYRGDLRSFELANTAVIRKPPRIRKKSLESQSFEEELAFCVPIHVKKKTTHKKVNKFNEKKAAKLEANLAKVARGEELFEMANQTASTEVGSPHVAPAHLSENGLIFPKLEEGEEPTNASIFKKMEEKEKERLEKNPQPPKKSTEILGGVEKEVAPEFIVVTKKKKSQKERKHSRTEEVVKNKE